MSGFPGETDKDLAETFNLMDELKKVNPETQHFRHIGLHAFSESRHEIFALRIYAAAVILHACWDGIEVFQFSPPWHSKKQIEKLHAISAVARCAFYPKSRIKDRALAFRFAYGLLNRVARYRWQQRYFGFSVELKIADAVARKFKGFL